MSKAEQTFSLAILDAENLLRHFDSLNTKPPPPELEVLKRAGLIMTITAWETYVEDRVLEASSQRLASLSDRSIAQLVEAKLGEELKKLHNPDSRKTTQLFSDFAGTDVAEAWCWNGVDSNSARARLDGYIRLRGEVVHRSTHVCPGKHPVKKGDLLKAINFIKRLVAATEKALEKAHEE